MGLPEIPIVLVILMLIRGAGRLSQPCRALGQGIREFREGTQGLGEEDAPQASSGKSAEA